MMSVGVALPEGSAVAGAQYLFAGIGDQCQLAIQHPDELVLASMPVTLARPSARLDDSQVDTEQSQPRIACQSLAGLTAAGDVEGTRIVAAGLSGYGGQVELLHFFPGMTIHPGL